MNRKMKQMLPEIIFLTALFVFIFLWAFFQPFNVSPDERMRYDIVRYLVEFGKLPHGGDPVIRDANWGISYAFNPILPYMIMAFFVKMVSWFTQNEAVLLMVARMVNILLGCGTGYVLLQLGKRFFRRWHLYLFATLVMFMPGTIFLFSYVNADGLALFATSLILLFWVRVMDGGWTLQNCIGLAVGLGLCALSYYNAYGVILVSVLYFTADVLLFNRKKWDFRLFFSRGFLIAAVALLIAGWWFVRSYLIYDGDILGMKTSAEYAQLYAIEELKPENRFLFYETGGSILDMFLYVPGRWEHNWIVTVAVSFIGTFGYMTVFMPYWLSKAYLAVFAVGILGLLIQFRETFAIQKREELVKMKMIGSDRLKIRCTQIWSGFRKIALFHWCLVLTAFIPAGLLVYYAYCSDFQAQGRYLMPGLPAIGYFTALGIGRILQRFVKKEQIRQRICQILTILWLAAAVAVFLFVFYPSCVSP